MSVLQHCNEALGLALAEVNEANEMADGGLVSSDSMIYSRDNFRTFRS